MATRTPRISGSWENWDSRELWQKHMNAQHLKDYMAATERAVEDFTLREMTHIA